MPKRLLLAAAGAIPGLFLLSGTGIAADRDATLTGNRLAVDVACARHVQIQPDPGLQGSIVVHATADHPEELDRLVLEQQDGVRVRNTPGQCWKPDGTGSWQPTLALSIRTPLRTPLSIDAPGDVTYAIGDVGGPLRLDLSGSVRLESGSVGPVQAELSGDDRVRIAAVEGDARIEVSGSGQVIVERGQVGHAALEVSGDGSIRIGAPIVDASAEISGSGTIALTRVSGTLSRDVSGSGTVTVGQEPASGASGHTHAPED